MKQRSTKIVLFILIGLIFAACNVTKRVPKGKKLLVKTEIAIDTKISKSEDIVAQLYQKPNTSILGLKIRLTLFNWAKPKSDSTYAIWLKKKPNREAHLNTLLSKKQVARLGKSFMVSGISEFLKKTGEPPTIFDSISTEKSLKRLNYFYFNKGYFDVKSSYKATQAGTKKVKIKYNIVLGKPFLIDSLKTTIETPALDSLYQSKKANSFLKNNKQYNREDFDNERSRITYDFRNSGAYDFKTNYISYNLDTINTNKKANISVLIKNYSFRKNDSTQTVPFKLYKISKVNIFADHSNTKNQAKIKDSVTYKQYTFYIENKLKYKPKSITNAIFLSPGNFYSDNNQALSIKYLSNLRIFNFPSIIYEKDPKDDSKLIANVYLTPRKKYTFNPAIDFTRSNIQLFGVSGSASFGIKNVFNGAETFEIGFRGNLGASKDFANPDNRFFNISEYGIDTKLNFPRIVLPFNSDKIIPKSMLPSTTLNAGFAKQTNIGLDKLNFTSSFSYNWTPSKNTTFRFDLLNIQYVKNVNVGNYFNIYRSSYDALNLISNNYTLNPNFFENGKLKIETGTNGFLDAVLGNNPISITPNDLKTVKSINERKNRLTENNLIFATNISYTKTSKNSLFDENFYTLKTKIESAGSLLSVFASASKALKNQGGANTIFDVEFSQYIKTEFEFIKHWQISNKKVVAFRSFTGIAIPYGNSKSIPFSRSYFSGGSNDNRAWQPYSLGPGSSGGTNDFNEANFKIALNAEFRFKIVGKVNGALFIDAGNIWNALDNVTEESYKFKGFNSYKEIAVGSGFGLRYDQGLFVFRADLGFKTYNPAKEEYEKWGKEINFSKSVINIGINYPF